MNLRESLYFFSRFQESIATVGSILPTSQFAAVTMASEFVRMSGPRTVLEAGSGTGAITAAIVEQMRPGDRLICYEMDAGLADFLRQRFANEDSFRRVRDQVEIVEGDVMKIDPTLRFDAIISAIPFNNLPATLIAGILDTYKLILKPGGTFTYIEYAYLRKLRTPFLSGESLQRHHESSAVLDPFLRQYEYRRDLTLRNVPPAWIHHLRLSAAEPSHAQRLRPAESHHRYALGDWGLSSEALPWVGGLALLHWLVPGLRRGNWLLWLAAAVAAFFRDPKRDVINVPNRVYAASDGKVLSVERLVEPRFGDQEWVRVAVFLSLLDTHINRSPIAGKVINTTRVEGGYASANTQAAEHNFALFTELEGEYGRCIVAQRSGLIARRIVSWAAVGSLLAQGDRFGLIRFGSRTDIYLPAEKVKTLVKAGDRVTGGQTVVAEYLY